MITNLIAEISAGLSEVSGCLLDILGSIAESRINDNIKQRYRRPVGHLNLGNPTSHPGSILPTLSNTPARVVVQEHHADKAGPHWDLRLVMNGRAYSWVVGPSKRKIAVGKSFGFDSKMVKIVRQPDHMAEYANFEGEIASGYGKGTVRKVFDADVLVLKSTPTEVQFAYNGSKVTLFSMDEDWGMVASPSTYTTGGVRLDKGNYTTQERKLQDAIKSGEYYAEYKVDGSNFTLSVERNGVPHLVSHRLGVDSKPIDRSHRFINLARLINRNGTPLPAGTVIQGEIWHPRGANYTAGLLNSSPLKAYLAQRKTGYLKFTLWDIASYDGKNISRLPYEERRVILEEVTKKHGLQVASRVKITSETQLQKFYHRSLAAHGEGIVLKHREQDYYGDNHPMIKMKASQTDDLEIVGFTEGEGRLAGRAVGALICQVPCGSVNVGSGMSDSLRRWFWENKDKAIGGIVEVIYMEPTETGSLRAPRFSRIHPSKSELPLMMYASGLDPKDMESALYKTKSASGWRRNI